jgi:hypothetical protein
MRLTCRSLLDSLDMKALGHPSWKDRRPQRGYLIGVILLVLVGLIAQGACLPHTHSGVAPGVYNAEHDLTLLAASGAIAPVPAQPSFFVPFLTAPIHWLPAPSAVSIVGPDAESRAPPTA